MWATKYFLIRNGMRVNTSAVPRCDFSFASSLSVAALSLSRPPLLLFRLFLLFLHLFLLFFSLWRRSGGNTASAGRFRNRSYDFPPRRACFHMVASLRSGRHLLVQNAQRNNKYSKTPRSLGDRTVSQCDVRVKRKVQSAE